MKIAFVAAQDPSNSVQFFSGIPYHLYWALRGQAEVIPMAVNVQGPPKWWDLYSRIVGKATGVQSRWGMRPEVVKELSDKAARKALESGADVVLTVGQGYLVFWNSSLPAATFSDILYGSVSEEDFQDDGEKRRRLNRQQQRQMAEYAQRAVDRALHVFITSTFSLEGARRFGTEIASNKVSVTQIGANFSDIPDSLTVRQPPPPLKLLWLGSSWYGKGGAVAVAVLDRLLEMGLPVELNLVGDMPAALTHPHVTAHGFLHKDVAAERARLVALYQQSHLLLLPTRRDITPSGLAEAAAFGVPAVTTPVGGIPGMFAENEVCLLPFERYREEAPAVIMRLLENGRLAEMSAQVRQRFETTLNWDVIAGKIVSELGKALENNNRGEI